MLKPRQLEVLRLLIQLFTNTKQPVGSATLKTEGIAASSATIRNDLALLEAEGLIEKTHVSSGRIPSLKGYRYYLDHLLQPVQLSEGEQIAIQESLQAKAPLLQDFLQEAADELAKLTQCTSFISELDQASKTLASFQLLALNSKQVMAVMLTSDGQIEQRLCPLQENITATCLQEVEAFVQIQFVGQNIQTIQQRLRTELPITLQRVFTCSSFVLSLLNRIFDQAFKEKFYVSGAMNLLDDQYWDSAETFKEVYHLIYSDFVEQLTQKMASPCVHIFLGSELGHPLLKEMALIAVPYQVSKQGQGILALLGPANLAYAKTLARLQSFKEKFEQQVVAYHMLATHPMR